MEYAKLLAIVDLPETEGDFAVKEVNVRPALYTVTLVLLILVCLILALLVLYLFSLTLVTLRLLSS